MKRFVYILLIVSMALSTGCRKITTVDIGLPKEVWFTADEGSKLINAKTNFYFECVDILNDQGVYEHITGGGQILGPEEETGEGQSIYLQNEWVEAKKEYDEKGTPQMRITVKQNESGLERSCRITVSCADSFSSVFVHQKG